MRHHYNPGKDARHDRNTKSGMRKSMEGGSHEIDFTPLYRFLLRSVGKNWEDVHSDAVSRLGDHRDAVWHIVELPEDSDRISDRLLAAGHITEEKHRIVNAVCRIGDNSMYSKLTIKNGVLVVFDPYVTNEMLEPSCECCTHTFNGKPLVKKFNVERERAGFGKNYVAPPPETEIVAGCAVSKLSGKPFKSGTNVETVVSLSVNDTDPRKRPCAVFADGSVCNTEMLIRINKTKSR
jgi:hypothetical protein